MTIRTVLSDARKTAINGALLIAAVTAIVAIGPHVELALAPPVRTWEIHDARYQSGEIRWSVLIAQKRRCIPSVRWSVDGNPLTTSGPPLTLTPGEATEIGPFSAPQPIGMTDGLLRARVLYNCGAPWMLAPIEKTVLIK